MNRTKTLIGAVTLSVFVLIASFGIAGPQHAPIKPPAKPETAKVGKTITREEAQEIWNQMVNAPALASGEDRFELSLTHLAAPQNFDSEEAAFAFFQYDAVCREFELRMQQFSVGKGSLEQVLNCANRRFHSHMRVSKSKEERVRFCDEFEALMGQLYGLQRERYKSGNLSQQDLEQSGGAMAEFHIQALKIKAER